MKKKKQTNSKALWALISIILLLLLGSIISIFLISTSESSYTAHIYQDGQLLESIDLSTVTQSYQLTFEAEGGSYNIVEIRPGQIAVTDASCPDHICVNQGFIHNSMLPITCLPNKLVIQLKENTTGITPDVITY
ncbi:MAG: NusG domain II-containing protein [Lachnospiraceae bacterium]|nr:NusG domain II-containing protein [Lachnospiraceae bacterium]